MVYVAFDMDGTLGNFMVLWPIITGLLHSDGDRERNPLYIDFVRQMAIREKGSTPLGIFRPGIFDVMRRVAKMKKAGSVSGVIIYTNNGSLELAEFVRDVIHRVLRYKLFDDVIHFYHGLRVVGADGRASNQKTWFELYHLLTLGLARAPDSIRPADVLFVDDQEHTDLMTSLGTNYVHVPEYSRVAAINPIIDMISSAVMTHLGGGTDLFKYTGYHGPLERYIGYLRRDAEPASVAQSTIVDSGSVSMLKALHRVGSPYARRTATRRNRKN
jgi:hypothetical protein